MDRAYGGLIGEVIAVLLLSFLNAGILRWRARKRLGEIRLRDAYVVSNIAGFLALIFGELAVSAVTFTGNYAEDVLKSVGMLFGMVVTWWLAHSSALLKLTGPSNPLEPQEARAISASVFLYLFGVVFCFALLISVLAVLYGEAVLRALSGI